MKEVKKGTINNLIFMLKHIWQWDRSIFPICFFNSVVTALAPFIWIIIPKLLLDELEGAGDQSRIISILVIALIVAVITHYSLGYFKGKYRMKMSGVRFHFIDEIHSKAMSMPYALTEDPKTLNDIQQAWKTVRNPFEGVGIVMQKLFIILGSFLGLLGYISIISTLSFWILLYFIVNVLILYVVHNKVSEYDKSQESKRSQLYRKSIYVNRTLSDFQYGKDIRLYQMKDYLTAKKKVSDKELVEVEKDVANRRFKVYLLEAVLLLFREGVIYAYLIYRVLGGMSIANFTMYAVAIGGFAAWMESLMKDFVEMKRGCMYIEDLHQFLLIEDEVDSADCLPLPKEDTYKIEFQNVSFKYPHTDNYVFKDLNLVIEKGQKLAIVGINGAGKTTLIKLLTRLFYPTEGCILLNGVNINSYSLKEYHRLYSIVFQEITKFAFSVDENITLSTDQTDVERLQEATKQAGIYQKIKGLNKGFDTSVLKVVDPKGGRIFRRREPKAGISKSLV